jgi:hypothetical protein
VLLTAFVPLAILACLGLGLFLPLLICDRLDFSDSPKRREWRHNFRLRSIKLVLFAIFLVGCFAFPSL